MFRIRCLQQEQVTVRVGVFTWIAALTGSCLQVTFEVGGEGGVGGLDGGSLIWLEHNLFVYLVCLFVSFFFNIFVVEFSHYRSNNFVFIICSVRS